MKRLLDKLDEIEKDLNKYKHIVQFIKATAKVVDNKTFVAILDDMEDWEV